MAEQTTTTPAPAVRRKGPNVKAIKNELKNKTRDTMKRLKDKQVRKNVRHTVEVIAAPAVLGLVHRGIAASAEKRVLNGRKFVDLSRDEQAAATRARATAAVPHVRVLGDAGTYGALLTTGGLLLGQSDMLAAGSSLLGTELYLRARGSVLIDRHAAERMQAGVALQAVLAGAAGDDTVAGSDEFDELAGDDDDAIDVQDLSGVAGGDRMLAAEQVAGALDDDEAAAVLELAGDDDAALLQLLAQGA